MRAQVLVLCLGLSSWAPRAFPQVLSCQTLQGQWTENTGGQQYNLSQDNAGNLTGSMTWPSCTGNQVWPLTGIASAGTFSFIATNPGCTNFYGGATITFSGDIGQPGCNFLYGSQTDADGTWYTLGTSNPYPITQDPLTPNWVAKAVDVPDSETSTTPPPAAWNASKGAPWNQKLAPDSPTYEYEGRGIYEYGNGAGTDTCWFPESKFPIYDTISTPGFAWTVSSKNTWGADWIGWYQGAVKYYRAQNRVPCGSRFPQLVMIDAAYSPDNTPAYSSYLTEDGDIVWGVAYETNILGGDITATSVTSIRNGQTSTNTTW
jgi:hypothetical protein